MFDILNTPPRTKTCSCCGEEKPLSEFHRRRHYVRSGHRAACKACTREISRRAREETPRPVDKLKARIRARTGRAIRRGELVVEPCRVCGRPAESHHPDYLAPDAHLQVEFLCTSCHALEHGTAAWTRQMDMFVAFS